MDQIKVNKRRRAMALAIKRIAIKYKGEICRGCGRTFHTKTFCFHHVNEEEKSFDINDFINKYRCRPKRFMEDGYKKLFKELDKCMLLCHNCHSDIHAKDQHDDEVVASSKEMVKKIQEVIKNKNKTKNKIGGRI